jgi:hypothetical protein
MGGEIVDSEIVKVSKEAFLGLVEGYLSEDRPLYLIVEGMAVTKEIGCSGQYCTEILKVASPDDNYTEVALQKPAEREFIEREYKCKEGHITKVYWCGRRQVVPSV